MRHRTLLSRDIELGLIFAFACPNGIKLTILDTAIQGIALTLLMNIKHRMAQSNTRINDTQPQIRKDDHDRHGTSRTHQERNEARGRFQADTGKIKPNP
jgi:hypothetical protein